MTRRRNRFDVYDARCNLEHVERAGILNSRLDFELGTASLERRENVSLLAANSRGESISADIKWRPSAKDKRVVTIWTRFQLETDGCTYEHRQLVSYEPQSSPIRPGFITQYGGQQSSLKFYISEPYRRMRLTFQGCVRDKRSGSTKFIKAGFVVCPTSGNFDFLHQYDAGFMKKQLAASKGTTVEWLVAHDRHEQLVQIKGDFMLIESADGDRAPSRTKRRLYAWGFHIRHFLSQQKAPAVQTERILAHSTNGRALHLGRRSCPAGSVQFGYSLFGVPVPEPVESCRVDWDQVSRAQFQFEFTDRGKVVKGEASRRGDESSSGLLDAKLNGAPGWAWILSSADGDEDGDPDERESIEKSARELLEARAAGRLAKIATFEGRFGAKRPQIVRIDEQMCQCSDLVGAKAASLAQLHSFSSSNPDANYRVPPGFVLTRFAHDAVLETNLALKKEISKLEWLMGEGDLSILKEECERLRTLVSEAKLPDGLRDELTAYIENNYSQEELSSHCFAVRSSSWGEDEDDMSGAGQLTTILGVCGLESILAAVMECFASKFTVANIEYKRQHGLPAGLPMAVVVQEMVDCEKAGVLFTCDPTTGDDSRLTITANYGLGESVVSGQSEPDSITVARSTHSDQLLVKEIVVGAKAVVIEGKTLRKGAQSQGSQHDRSKCCLDEAEILRLARCGLALAHHFQGPRDIEWGFKGDQLYLLQSRPVTGLDSYSEFELMHEADLPSAAENEFTTRANIGEVIPFAMKPMTMTSMFRIWAAYSSRMRSRFNRHRSSSFECSRDLLCVAYHAFFNLRGPMMNMRNKAGEKHKRSKSFEIAILGRELEDEPELRAAVEEFACEPPSLIERQAFKMITLDLRLAPASTVRSIKRSLAEARQGLRELKFATGYHENKMLGLYNQLKHTFDIGFAGWRAHSLCFMVCKEHNSRLAAALAKHLGNDRTKVLGAMAKFLSMSHDVLSAEIPQRVAKMAKMIKRVGQSEVDRFLSTTPDEAVRYLLKGDDDKLTAEFESFIEKFGHRCYHEFDIGSRQWAAEPGAVAEMIKQNCLVASDIVNKKLMTNDEIIDLLGLNLNKKDRFVLKNFLVPNCQQFVSVREKTKDTMIEHSDLLRLASRMLAKEMRRNLRIPDEDLFYYLQLDEVEPLIRGPQPSIVVQAVRRRHIFDTVFKDPWRFDEIIRGYEFTPNHLKPSKELDEKLANAPKLTGTPASSGRIRGKICLVDGYKQLSKVRPGDILLTHSTDIAFSPVFPLISGIITEVGGLVSHGAVVAREYGLPSVLGIPNVTRILRDQEEIILDADTGTIIRINFMESN